MAWTAPRTWVTGEVVTAALMNTHVRDDLRYLKGLDGDITIEANLVTAFNVDNVDVGNHGALHQNGGGQEISVTGLSGLLADDQHVLDAEVKLIKLDDFATPDDNTDLDFGTARHGLVPKGLNVGDFLRDNGSWAGGALVFYSEANDLSDLTRTSVDNVSVATESYYTFLNIASGGCRFLGGMFSHNGDMVLKVQVDGGAEQTISFFQMKSTEAWYMWLPPIKADTSLLIRAYNTDPSNPRDFGGQSWHRGL